MFLGGIIIIVIYITSLAANEKASVSLSGTEGILYIYIYIYKQILDRYIDRLILQTEVYSM